MVYTLDGADPVRDRMMADNLIAIRAATHAKMMIWAHNYHVGRYAATSMGTLLHRAWGRDYLAIGAAFAGGDFLAIGREDDGMFHGRISAHGIAAAAPYDSVAPLVATGVPLLVLDLRSLPAAAASWFGWPHPIREAGAGFISERQMTAPGTLADRFDAVLFVARSTPAHHRGS